MHPSIHPLNEAHKARLIYEIVRSNRLEAQSNRQARGGDYCIQVCSSLTQTQASKQYEVLIFGFLVNLMSNLTSKTMN